MRKLLKESVYAAAVILCTLSCAKTGEPSKKDDSRVLIVCSVGYNMLSSSLKENLEELVTGVNAIDRTPHSVSPALPDMESKDVLLSISHFPSKEGHFTDNDPVYLIKYNFDKTSGRIIRDTVNTYRRTMLTDADSFGKILSEIGKRYPSEQYGMIYSSHGTGWLPVGYSENSKVDITRSIGSERDGNLDEYETDVIDFASALPLHFEYLILDACYMGGVENIYQLRNKADFLISSPTLIQSDGMDYKNILSRLWGRKNADLRGVCDDFYNHYADMGSWAAISMVKTSALNNLASTCRLLFSEYRGEIYALSSDEVQRMYHQDMHRWFFDFKDIINKCQAIPDYEKTLFESSLDEAVVYKRCTETLDEIKVESYCGLNSYLPSAGNECLDEYYKTLDWNKEVELIK